MSKPEDDTRANTPEPSQGQARVPPRQPVDPAEYQQRLDRVTELFESMMSTANELSTRRCPYKNRHDQCTAGFGCRNQRKPEIEGHLMTCAGDDALDYRSAWETA
ncbi:MAG: hypothetical protein OXG37_11180 [Actinomycetia bacterium]|nr:hypothetical protein [Actinomycetes bacterium]